MAKLWRVAVYEYGRNVFKKSFIFMLLSVPCSIILMLFPGLYLESLQNNWRPVGIVDRAGVLSTALIPPEIQSAWVENYDKPLEFIAFETDEAARRALEAKEIQAYFILPERYLSRRQVEVVYLQEPGKNVWQQFYDILRISLLSGRSPEVAYRAAAGTDFIVRSIDGRREVPASSGPTFGLLMPLFIAMAFLVMLLMSAGYILSAVADEKENRTVEVLVTSISPTQLMGGKILGIVAISLTLLLSWAAVIGLGIFVARQCGIGWFGDLSLDWRAVAAVIAIAVPSYVLVTAVMTAIGAMGRTTQESQSISGIFIALHLAPLYISITFLKDPHSLLAVLLSLFPFTSLMTVGMRNLFTIVPTWQIVVSMIVQSISAVGAIWLASRAFRLGMVRYGQRLNIRHLLLRGLKG